MSYTCPACGMTSHHPVDEQQGYCGRCHAWTRQYAAEGVEVFGFSPRPDAWLARAGAALVSTPVGWPCGLCTTPIERDDMGFFREVVVLDGAGAWSARIRAMHAQCEALRIVGHANGVCRHTGWPASKAAADELWRRLGHVFPNRPESPAKNC